MIRCSLNAAEERLFSLLQLSAHRNLSCNTKETTLRTDRIKLGCFPQSGSLWSRTAEVSNENKPDKESIHFNQIACLLIFCNWILMISNVLIRMKEKVLATALTLWSATSNLTFYKLEKMKGRSENKCWEGFRNPLLQKGPLG